MMILAIVLGMILGCVLALLGIRINRKPLWAIIRDKDGSWIA